MTINDQNTRHHEFLRIGEFDGDFMRIVTPIWRNRKVIIFTSRDGWHGETESARRSIGLLMRRTRRSSVSCRYY